MAWKIESRWGDGFVLAVDGVESHHDAFVAAFARVADSRALATIDAPLMPVGGGDGEPLEYARPQSVFDAAYASAIDTRLFFDGAVFLVEIVGGDGARVFSVDDAQLWLERTIRATRPDSLFAALSAGYGTGGQ
ncbi:MAG TPA: hypothetical protein VGL86_18785 [Polyangia bacterium]